SGQDASVAGLQNVLLGKQWATVYKPVKLEADAAVETAIALLNGETPEADPELEAGTPFITVAPSYTRPETAKHGTDAGDASAAEVCTGDVAAKCDEFGIS